MIALVLNKAEIKKYDRFSGHIIISLDDLEECLENIETDELKVDSLADNVFGKMLFKMEELINADNRIKAILKKYNAERMVMRLNIFSIYDEREENEDFSKNLDFEFGMLRGDIVQSIGSHIGFGTNWCECLEDIAFWCCRYGVFERFLSFEYNCNTITNPFNLDDVISHDDIDRLEDIIMNTLKDFEIEQ